MIISNDVANRYQNRVQIVPVTSNTRRIREWEAPIWLDGQQRKALADQIRTVAKERLLNRLGEVSPVELHGIERAIRVQLALP